MQMQRLNKIVLFISSVLFFFGEIFLISVRSSTSLWILNIVIILTYIFYINKHIFLLIRKDGLFFYTIWCFFSFLLLPFDLVNNIDLTWSIKHCFIYIFQLPALALSFYILQRDDRFFYYFGLISFLVSAILFLLLKMDLIPFYKYQIVGNVALMTLIFIFQNTKINNILKLTLLFFLIMIIVLCGSRQSFVGLVIYLFLVLYYAVSKSFFKRLLLNVIFLNIILTGFLFLKKFDFEILFSQIEIFNQLELKTFSRLLSNFSISDNESNYYRIHSLELLIDNFRFLPNGYLYTNKNLFLEPHNFFVEIIFSYGFFFSPIILFYLIYGFSNSFKRNGSKAILMLAIVFLVPAFVSSGLHAARFFLIFFLSLSLFKNIVYE